MLKRKKVLFPLAAFALVGLLSACDYGHSSSGGSADSPDSSSVEPDSSDSSDSSPVDEITGSGTQQDPYLISSAKQYGDFVAAYNALTAVPSEKVYYKLGADINLAGTKIAPVGTVAVPFYGSFDGNGHKISGVVFNSFDKSVTMYGLFGYAYQSDISSLSITIDYDLAVMGAKSQIYVGGLVGAGINTVVEDVDVEGNIDIVSGQNTSSLLYVGGVAGILQAQNNYSVGLRNSSSKVDINCDMSDSADTSNLVGGIAGALTTSRSSSSIGIQYVASAYYSGSITGGTAVGGIAAAMSYYTSIVDCYAEGASLKATDTDGAYAGGIVGQGYYESAILHNFAGFSEISAAESTSTYYKSYAGSVIGYSYKNGYDSDDDTLGTVNYANYAKNDTKGSDVSGVDGEASEKGEAAIAAAGLSSSWSYKDGKVVLGKYAGSDKKVNVKMDANYDGGESETITASNGVYDYDAVLAINNKQYNRAGYSYVGLFYDKEGKQAYTWYTPFVADTTLYASYGDLSLLLGTWNYTCASVTGIWHFTEDTFYWQNKYYETQKYSYSFDGTYIFIGEGEGGYEGEIFKLEDGKITGYDMNDYDYVYTGTKSSSTFVVPDYSGESFLGTYYFSNGNYVILKADGKASGYSTTSTTEWTGGYTKLADGTFNIRVPARLMADGLNYDAASDVFYNSEFFGARESIEKTYATSDSKVKVYSTASKNYALKEGKLVSLSGELADGNEVVIGGVTYTVSGTTLTEKAAPVLPAEALGTWIAKVGSNSFTIVLGENGVCSYNGTDSTYKLTETSTGYTIKFSCGDTDVTLNYDSSSQTMSGSFEYDYNETKFDSVTKEAQGGDDKGDESSSSILGTYTDSNKNVMVLGENGSGTWNGTAFTYTYDEATKKGTISAFGAFDSDSNSFTVNADGTITVSVGDEYGENVYTGTMTKQAEDKGDDKGEATAPAYVGTWVAGSNTMVLSEDGNGTWNGEYSFTFTYDESTKKGKMTNFAAFEDDENYFIVNDNGTITIHLSGDYGDNCYNATMTKQA